MCSNVYTPANQRASHGFFKARRTITLHKTVDVNRVAGFRQFKRTVWVMFGLSEMLA